MPAWGWTLEGREAEEGVRRSLVVVILWEDDEESLVKREDVLEGRDGGWVEREEERDGDSFSSSSAKLRSFGGFFGLAAAAVFAVVVEGFEVGLIKGGPSPLVSSLSSSSARRRKFLGLLLMVDGGL